MVGFFRSGITYGSLLRALGSAAVIMCFAGLWASRSFIEPSDAIKTTVEAGYIVEPPESKGVDDHLAASPPIPVETHYVLPNRFGCKRADAIAFIVLAKKTKESKPEKVTVCCGAWFSGCAVREAEKE